MMLTKMVVSPGGILTIIIDRYRKLNTSNREYVDKLSQIFFKHCDYLGLSDESKQLTYSEFEEHYIVGMSAAAAVDNAGGISEQIFNALDINGDGYVTFDEWTAHYTAMGIPLEYARASFDAMDVNGDDKVSKDEFIDYHMEFYFSTENKLNSAILFGPI